MLAMCVVVDLQPGHDVGVVSLKGELVKSQMKSTIKDDHELKRISRKPQRRTSPFGMQLDSERKTP